MTTLWSLFAIFQVVDTGIYKGWEWQVPGLKNASESQSNCFRGASGLSVCVPNYSSKFYISPVSTCFFLYTGGGSPLQATIFFRVPRKHRVGEKRLFRCPWPFLSTSLRMILGWASLWRMYPQENWAPNQARKGWCSEPMPTFPHHKHPGDLENWFSSSPQGQGPPQTI